MQNVVGGHWPAVVVLIRTGARANDSALERSADSLVKQIVGWSISLLKITTDLLSIFFSGQEQPVNSLLQPELLLAREECHKR